MLKKKKFSPFFSFFLYEKYLIQYLNNKYDILSQICIQIKFNFWLINTLSDSCHF